MLFLIFVRLGESPQQLLQPEFYTVFYAFSILMNSRRKVKKKDYTKTNAPRQSSTQLPKADEALFKSI